MKKSHSIFQQNSKGMSLIEVMILVTIMGMLSLGMTTLMKNLFVVQKRTDMKESISEFKSNLEKVLRSDEAWANTVNLAANAAKLGCMRDNSAGCPANPYTITDFDVIDTGGTLVHGQRAIDGFGQSGAPCDTFDAAAGDDTCPFKYTLVLLADCKSGAPPCYKPRVTINGTLQFSPANRDTPANRIDLRHYTFSITRGDRDRFEPFEIQRTLTGAPATPNHDDGQCDNDGGPAVPPARWAVRPLDAAPVYDSGNNVTMAGNGFTLQPGTYECKISAQSYEALSGFSVRLFDTTNLRAYTVGGGFSGLRTTAYATGSISFEITSPATFQLQQYCETPRSEYDMGIPTPAPGPDYSAPSTVTNIACVRTS